MPTEKQYAMLLRLGSGAVALTWTKREVDPFLRRGWVTADPPKEGGRYWTWVRITAEGLHALARAVAKYGLPDMGPRKEAKTEVRVCGDCGSSRYSFRRVPAQDWIDEQESAA